MPDSPLISRRQTCSTPDAERAGDAHARHHYAPHDRRSFRAAPTQARLLLLDVVDRILHGADLLGRVLGDLDAERLLERHHQFDGIEAVGAQVVDERRLGRDLRFLDAQVLHHDLLNLVGDLAHRTRNSCLRVLLGVSARLSGVSSLVRRAGPDRRRIPAPDEACGPLSMVSAREPTRPPAVARTCVDARRSHRSSPSRRSRAAWRP